MRIPVSGMECASCVDRLERELRETRGVDAVEVRLKPGEAIIRGSADQATIRNAIRRCGFQPSELQSASEVR